MSEVAPTLAERQAFDAECSILGAMLILPELAREKWSSIDGEWFAEPLNRHLFDLIGRVLQTGSEMSIHRVRMICGQQWTQDLGLEGMTFGDYCTRLLSWPSREDIDFEVELIRSSHTVRELAEATSGEGDVDNDPLARARAIIDRVDAIRRKNHATGEVGPVSLGDAMRSSVETIQERAAGVVGPVVTTGLTRLDGLLSGGLRAGQLVVVAGRPGQGKSTFGLHIALAAARAGVGAYVASLEMTEGEFASRAISALIYDRRQRLTYHDMAQPGLLREAELNRLAVAARDLSDLPVLIDDAAGRNLPQIMNGAEAAQSAFEARGQKLGLVVIDHLGLIRPTDRYKSNRVQEITEITGAAKGMAKRMGIPVIVLAQLNRETERRDDKRPTLSDLRDSGSIEQDADIVMGLYREEYYLARIPDPSEEQMAKLRSARNQMEIEILKQRMGPTERVRAFCDIGCNYIGDLA